MAVYTGVETKIIQNLGNYKFKRSRMEKRMNETLIINLFILVFFITLSSIINGIITDDLFETHFYLTDNNDDSSTKTTLLAVVSFYILNNYLVPLDLAVSIEFNQLFYFGFLLDDAKMTILNREMGRIDSCKVNSLNLIENMAEIKYIMSDKTGTMTKNELTFVSVCASEKSSHCLGTTTTEGSADKTESIGDYLMDKVDFIKCVQLCHDCTILNLNEKGKQKKLLTGSSLDEISLLNSVKKNKVAEVEGREGDVINVTMMGKLLKFQVLRTNEFSSERKMMSVVIKDLETQQIFVYAKGAESHILRHISA